MSPAPRDASRNVVVVRWWPALAPRAEVRREREARVAPACHARNNELRSRPCAQALHARAWMRIA
jgi:hypothetical protein